MLFIKPKVPKLSLTRFGIIIVERLSTDSISFWFRESRERNSNFMSAMLLTMGPKLRSRLGVGYRKQWTRISIL